MWTRDVSFKRKLWWRQRFCVDVRLQQVPFLSVSESHPSCWAQFSLNSIIWRHVNKFTTVFSSGYWRLIIVVKVLKNHSHTQSFNWIELLLTARCWNLLENDMIKTSRISNYNVHPIIIKQRTGKGLLTLMLVSGQHEGIFDTQFVSGEPATTVVSSSCVGDEVQKSLLSTPDQRWVIYGDWWTNSRALAGLLCCQQCVNRLLTIRRQDDLWISEWFI